MIKKSKFLPIGDIFEFVTNSQILGDDTNSEILKKLDELKRDKSDTKMNNGTQEILFDNELAGSLSDDTKKKIIFSILNDYYGEKPIVKKSSITKNAGREKLILKALGLAGKKLFARNAANATGKATAQAAASGAARATGNATAQAVGNGTTRAFGSVTTQAANNPSAWKPSIWERGARYLAPINTAKTG